MSFRKDLDALSDRYVNNFIRGDAAACASVYEADGEMHHSMQECDRGQAAIEVGILKLMGEGVTVTKLTTLWSDASGDLGCAIQTFESTAGPGMVMLALRRNADGDWKVTREVMVPS